MLRGPHPERRRGRATTGLLAAGLLVVALLAASPGNAAPPEAATGSLSSASRGSSLFEARPRGWNRGTVERLGEILRTLPEAGPRLAAEIVERGRQAGVASSALLLLFMAILALAIGLQGWRARWVEARVAPVLADVAAPLRPWTAALAQIAAAALSPLVLAVLHEMVQRATGFAGPGFRLLAVGLWAWFVWALVTSSLRELLLRPLLPVSAEHGRYLFLVCWWLASAGLFLSALLEVAARAGAAGDLLALLAALLELALILLVALFATHKQAILGLLPRLPSRPYVAFVRGLTHFYPLILLLTLATALLDWAGYTRLASQVWRCSWVLAGLFITVVVALHLARLAIRHTLTSRQVPRGPADRLYRSSTRLIDYVAAIVALGTALEVMGARELVGAALAVPILRLGDRGVTALMLLEACGVVAGFWLVARVLRDFLVYRIYPALALEESVAHAINTFISYATLVVGVLVAFEVVGLGAGTVTVFAGALGIGLGFGMQSLAGDVSSGLTLIFGRTLRKGDIVRIGETTGEVQEVGVRATSLISQDAVEYLVPNTELASGTVVNWTRSTPYVREHVPVGVGYGADPEHVIALLREVAARTPGVEVTPEPEVWFTGLGESSLSFEVLVWVDYKHAPRQRVRSDLYRAIFRELRTAGIEIPYAQRDLHIRSLPAAVLSALAPASSHGGTTADDDRSAGRDPSSVRAQPSSRRSSIDNDVADPKASRARRPSTRA